MSTGHDTGGWITHFWLSNLRQNIPVFDLSRSSICLSKTTEINRTLPLTYVKPQEACQVLHCLPLAPQAPGTRLLAASSIMCHLHDLLTNFSQPPLSTLLLGWRPLTMCPTSVSEYSQSYHQLQQQPHGVTPPKFHVSGNHRREKTAPVTCLTVNTNLQPQRSWRWKTFFTCLETPLSQKVAVGRCSIS